MIGQRLGSFHLDQKIGSGAMGEVFKATQMLKDGRKRTAAVKVVSAEYLERENALRRFQREAEILAQLRHPNIVRYYAHGKFKGIYYYAMEFVDGETLEDLLGRREFLPWREAIDLGIQICHALHYAHEHQVVHRDLKPSNLMVTGDDRIKLTDFGIAKDLDATVALTRTGRTLGTAAYMAPEQIKGTPQVSHKTDLYALGCLLYQMITGRPPFEGRSAVILMHAHIAEEPPRPSGKNPEIPRALDDLVVHLMAKEPPDRPWDAAQVAHLLEQLRDRDERGDRVPMAFDKARAEVAAKAPPTAGDGTAGGISPGNRPRAGKPRKAKAGADRGPRPSRQQVETGLLVIALIGLVAFAAYMLWPPGADYLHGKAAAMMATDSRSDWIIARRKYIEPLRGRFPDRYEDDVSQWLAQIALAEAEDRAKHLEGGVPGANEPNTYAERLYTETVAEIERREELGQRAAVVGQWRSFTAELEERGDPDEIGWLRLGQKRLERARERLQAQHETAQELFAQADAAIGEGHLEVARVLLEEFVETYGRAAPSDPFLASRLRIVQSTLVGVKQALASSAAPAAAVAPDGLDMESPPGTDPPEPGDEVPESSAAEPPIPPAEPSGDEPAESEKIP